MNRIDKKLQELKANHRKMLSPYITAGDPTPDATVSLMHSLVKAGADILEIGIPFSDPMAEGPVIQAAMERALAFKVNARQVLDMIATFRREDKITPVVLMGYVNPIEIYGYERFAEHAKMAGVDGTILVDLPPEECEEVHRIWQSHGLHSIYLCSPTTSAKRMQLINRYAQGYIYYVSLKGVTGADTFDIRSVEQGYVQRKSQTSLPLMVGFGIKTADIAAKVVQFADGIIIGAALINSIYQAYEQHKEINDAASTLIQSIRQALDGQKND